jgi:hypothetical protein
MPNKYLKELLATNGEEQVRVILESHLISASALEILLRDPFTPADFEAFISERQRTMQEAIEELLIKERLDMSPQVRELDARIERIELGLRAVVVETLASNGAVLPSHVREQVVKRVQSAAQRNASINPDNYHDVASQIEYCDLREVQDTITAKALWPLFEPRFVHKVMLDSRFAQLADLRNSIRHSRRVDEISRKDGEAAILWFEQTLSR